MHMVDEPYSYSSPGINIMIYHDIGSAIKYLVVYQ